MSRPSSRSRSQPPRPSAEHSDGELVVTRGRFIRTPRREAPSLIARATLDIAGPAAYPRAQGRARAEGRMVVSSIGQDAALTRDELRGRALALVPMLRERA